jgi:hypothetical protein
MKSYRWLVVFSSEQYAYIFTWRCLSPCFVSGPCLSPACLVVAATAKSNKPQKNIGFQVVMNVSTCAYKNTGTIHAGL